MFIGTAGWSIPQEYKDKFPREGSHLARYACAFNMVEINSSFYREHQAKTYERWAREVPAGFKFSVKLSKAFLHDCDMRPEKNELKASLENILHLGEKLGVILIQLPPSMDFHQKNSERLYKLIRKSYSGQLALEPRNTTWVSREAQDLLRDYEISKVIADPEKCPGGRKKSYTYGGLTYYRLHGSPVIYRSRYEPSYLKKLTQEMLTQKNVWCVFDNTTFGNAYADAFLLKKMSK